MFVPFVPTSANVVVTNAGSIMLNIASDVPRRVEYVLKNADAWRRDKMPDFIACQTAPLVFFGKIKLSNASVSSPARDGLSYVTIVIAHQFATCNQAKKTY